jgi:hypothetical protein
VEIIQLIYPPGKKKVGVYFDVIVIIIASFLKNNDIFGKLVKFPITLYMYIFICTNLLKKKSSVMKGTSSLDSPHSF